MLRDQTVKCAKFCGQFPNWGPDPTGELDTFSTSSGRVEIPNPLNSPPNPQRHFNSYFDAFMFKELNDDDNDDLTTTPRRPYDDLTTSQRPHDDDDGDMDMTTSSTSSTSHNDDDDEMMTIIP